jgi:hypothetical protein
MKPVTGPYLEGAQVQSTVSHPISLTLLLILFSHTRQVFTSGFFFQVSFGFPYHPIHHIKGASENKRALLNSSQTDKATWMQSEMD